MTKVNVDRAVSFVQSSGDPVLSALALFATGRIGTGEAIDTISVYQMADGGWTRTDKDFQGDPSAISTTWVALQWLLWIEAGDSDVLEKTVAYLRTVQKADGCWDEPEEIVQYNPPHWMLPGRYENRLWLTSAVCCKLKELGRETKVAFYRALDFLRRGWDGTRYPAFDHTHWMVMGLLSLEHTDSVLDERIISGCKAFLYDAVVSDRVDPCDLSAIAYASLLAGERTEDLLKLSLDRILKNQLQDGGWKTNYGEKHRAGCMVDALFLLRRIGLIQANGVGA